MSNLDHIAQLFNDENESQIRELEQMLREREVASVRSVGAGTNTGLAIEFECGSAAVIQAPERQRGLQVEIAQ